MHRKGACHSIDLSSLPYRVLCTPAGYVICITGMEPAIIHAIPEDIKDLLLEFDLIMTGLGSIAEEELIEFNARMMAGNAFFHLPCSKLPWHSSPMLNISGRT